MSASHAISLGFQGVKMKVFVDGLEVGDFENHFSGNITESIELRVLGIEVKLPNLDTGSAGAS